MAAKTQASDQALELDEKERKDILGFFEKVDLDTLKASAEAIMMMVRAFNGQAPEPSDIISKLIDVKNKMERSRFPTYPLLAKQVYLRLIAAIHPEAISCEKWADFEASALVQYKGEGRKEWVEATKVANATESNIMFGMPQAQAEKRGLLHRRPKESRDEGAQLEG